MKRILIVEDDSALSMGLCRALKSEEIETVPAENLRTAKKQLEKHEISLVILDVNLPDGNGFDFLPFVKNTYGIPVIMLTANDLESDIVAGLEAVASYSQSCVLADSTKKQVTVYFCYSTSLFQTNPSYSIISSAVYVFPR